MKEKPIDPYLIQENVNWDANWSSFPDDHEFSDLYAALKRLGQDEPRLAKVVELVHLQSTSKREAAELIGVHTATIRRDEQRAFRLLAEYFEQKEKRSPLQHDVRLATFTDELYQWLLEDPDRLYGITDEQFERLVADRLSAMGLGVQRVGPTRRKDGGIDLVAWPETTTPFPFLLAAQVKHHKSKRKTPVSAVRDLTGVLTSSGSHFHLGVLVTNTAFTADAQWFAQHNTSLLRLRDLADVCRWMRNDFDNNADWREIPDEIELAPGISVAIPKRKSLWTPNKAK